MTESYYKSHIFCCNNERPADHPRGSCKGRGGEPLRNFMRARIKELGVDGTRVNVAGCMDRCELGPVMVIYPEAVWYTYSSEADVEEIVSTHLQKGGRVERLMLSNQK